MTWEKCQGQAGLIQDLVSGPWAAHPCYLGASYLNCGWAWLYECWQSDEPIAALQGAIELWPLWPQWRCCVWVRAADTAPHRCTHRPQERWQCLE